jgi:hypothetical protein
MPSLVSAVPINVDDFGAGNAFNGLIVIFNGMGIAADATAGIGEGRHLILSVVDGIGNKAHLCSENYVLEPLRWPVTIAPTTGLFKYRVGWHSGDAKALRADLAANRNLDRGLNTTVSVPASASVDLSQLWSFRV